MYVWPSTSSSSSCRVVCLLRLSQHHTTGLFTNWKCRVCDVNILHSCTVVLHSIRMWCIQRINAISMANKYELVYWPLSLPIFMLFHFTFYYYYDSEWVRAYTFIYGWQPFGRINQILLKLKVGRLVRSALWRLVCRESKEREIHVRLFLL